MLRDAKKIVLWPTGSKEKSAKKMRRRNGKA